MFSGRKRGAAVRRAAELDKHDMTADSVRIIIPADTISFNSSFFLGLLGPSVRKFRQQFASKYIIDCPPLHLPEIDEGKARALLESNVLTGGE